VRESGPVGWFLEVLTPSADRLEVLYSTPDGTEGVGHLQAHLSEQSVVEHAYWGSMRDRLPASQTEALTGPQGPPAAVRAGKRVRVAPRDNLSMIRSGQNWSQTEGHERSVYLEKVRPALIAGMAYLRDHGRDIGCYSCRFMQVVDAHGADGEELWARLLCDPRRSGSVGRAPPHASGHLQYVPENDGAAGSPKATPAVPRGHGATGVGTVVRVRELSPANGAACGGGATGRRIKARFGSHGAGSFLRFGWMARWGMRQIMARVTIASDTSGRCS